MGPNCHQWGLNFHHKCQPTPHPIGDGCANGLWCKYPRSIGYSGLSRIQRGVVSQLSSLEELHFDREVIILWVRWCLRYKLSFRDLVEMMAERGLNLAHTTILRWVRPISRYAATGLTSIERWTRLDRRSTFRLSRTREVAAAPFFKKAIRHAGRSPHRITLDRYAASHRAVREMRTDGILPKRTVWCALQSI